MKILNKLKLLLALLFLPLALITNANAFPDKGVTLIVAYGAGGGTDRTARLLAKDLETTIGQPVTVKNVTGGGGWNTGVDAGRRDSAAAGEQHRLGSLSRHW